MGFSASIGDSLKYARLLGEEYTVLTTTIGSLDAKIISLHPAFAGMYVRVLRDQCIDSSSVVGISASGSFPALFVSVLAALQVIGARAVIVSSVGASSYGANQQGATLLDIETWLRTAGGMKFKSMLVTRGAEDDSGAGLTEEGIRIIDSIIVRNGYSIFVPVSLANAIEKRLDLFISNDIDIVINIGGNQAMIGGCIHGTSLPNGLLDNENVCVDPDRGVILRLLENDRKVFHTLNIKSLAATYGIPSQYDGNTEAKYEYEFRRTTDRRIVLPAIFLLVVSIIIVSRMKKPK